MIRRPAVTAYVRQATGFPSELLFDARKRFLGFTMCRGHGKALHHAYGIQDRLANFPDKSWRFCVRAAKNLALAFAEVHDSGFIIADVNQNNALVDATGNVYLIDCDSWQFQSGSRTYYCSVGVPEYLSPELSLHPSLRFATRTKSDDNFSLAILIFQLLYLGRHPFMGVPRSQLGNFELAENIREKRYAYGGRELSPPPGAAAPQLAGDDVQSLLTRAFTGLATQRPTARDWAVTLEQVLRQLTHCSVNNAHVWRAGTGTCPWCQYLEHTLQYGAGTDPYPTDAEAAPQLVIESGSHEFPVDRTDYSLMPSQSLWRSGVESRLRRCSAIPTSTSSSLKPMVVPAYVFVSPYDKNQFGRLAASGVVSLLLLVLSAFLWATLTQAAAFLALVIVARNAFAWLKSFRSYRGELSGILSTYMSLVAESESSALSLTKARQSAAASLSSLATSVNGSLSKHSAIRPQFSGIGANRPAFPPLQTRAELREQALQRFLSKQLLQPVQLPYVHAMRKASLVSFGIETAADVQRDRVLQVHGIGPVCASELMAWKQSCIQRFVEPADYGAQDPIRIAEQQRRMTAQLDFQDQQQRKLRRDKAIRDREELEKRIEVETLKLEAEFIRLEAGLLALAEDHAVREQETLAAEQAYEQFVSEHRKELIEDCKKYLRRQGQTLRKCYRRVKQQFFSR